MVVIIHEFYSYRNTNINGHQTVQVGQSTKKKIALYVNKGHANVNIGKELLVGLDVGDNSKCMQVNT